MRERSVTGVTETWSMATSTVTTERVFDGFGRASRMETLGSVVALSKPDTFASVHGAWQSGERAAEAALAVLGYRGT